MSTISLSKQVQCIQQSGKNTPRAKKIHRHTQKLGKDTAQHNATQPRRTTLLQFGFTHTAKQGIPKRLPYPWA